MTRQTHSGLNRGMNNFFGESALVMALETNVRWFGGKPQLSPKLMWDDGRVYSGVATPTTHLHSGMNNLPAGQILVTLQAINFIRPCWKGKHDSSCNKGRYYCQQASLLTNTHGNLHITSISLDASYRKKLSLFI
jgi:hypothetical protein